MAADDDDSPSRAQLERIAFGRATTPLEIEAAQEALERLAAQDAARAEARASAAAPRAGVASAVAGGAADESTAEADIEAEPREEVPGRRRSLVPLLVVVGLFAGALGGVLLAHAEGTSIDPATADATGSTPTPAPTADAGAALKSLLVPQTKADKEFPLQSASTTLDIQPASIHRILTAADGATLWTGRTDTDICLMWTAASRSAQSSGGIGCATPIAFADGGLKLSEGLITWTWDGTNFTTTLAN
jgi:hypothetical protein